ncbi:MAG: hypothetical protein IJ193_06875 [Bacilli bacterium]|nr:hypothetical protein [Bacilli bacterium]
MNLTKDNVRTSYLKGVNNLVGKGIVTPKMERIIRSHPIDENGDYALMYYSLTRGLIDGMSSIRSNLSEDLRDGFAESLALRIWQQGNHSSNDLYSDGFNERKIYNDHWIPYLIGDFLVSTIGEQESAICMLKSPNLMGQLLQSACYDNSNLLRYLEKQIPIAKAEFDKGNKNFLDTDSQTIECCMAIADCADQLQLPAKRLKKQKVLSRVRKFMGKENEGQEL